MPSKTIDVIHQRAEQREERLSARRRDEREQEQAQRASSGVSQQRLARMPKLPSRRSTTLTLCLAAGTVIMAIKGIASSVPTALERPSCHQTSGASDERFQRTNPNGTEYTTADTG